MGRRTARVVGAWVAGLVLAGGSWAGAADSAAEGLAGANAGAAPGRLGVSENGRFLVDEHGKGVFLLCDTAWDLAKRLKREDVNAYMEKRRQQGFNAVTFVLFDPTLAGNAYGAAPFERGRDGKYDPARPRVTAGADPGVAGQYDYWDHVDYVVDEAGRRGLYVIALPAWGNAVAGGYRGEPTKEIVFDAERARKYGRWLGERYRERTHLIWMTGGDRSAAYAEAGRDYRAVFRAMGEGLLEGASGVQARLLPEERAPDRRPAVLISFHPQKGGAAGKGFYPQSSEWFHREAWLAFNSIQLWPEHQWTVVRHDWGLSPAKPTWVFEPRYEGYWKKPYKAEEWGAWQMRFQAYQSVLSGGFGFTYGHERIFSFGADGWDWKKELDAPGARQMRHLAALMSGLSNDQYLGRIPDDELIEGDPGKAERLKSDRVTAARGADGSYALLYLANGRPVRVRLERLAGPRVDAF